AIVPVFLLPWWSEFQAYFFSVYQNTITQLTWFLAAMLSLFLGMHIYTNSQFRRARNDIPLVIGGWGTRGKSGTERLKAALFNGLGLSILSKTTGCEAMFVYAGKNRPLFEMFLFRPYDKATIWEQVNVTRIAKGLNTDVLLWECMGLTPRYIEILQQQWMQDDIATIVNCYPDHEDLQGPAGVDIPKVMMNFVPKNSVLLTTEENMLPYLKLAARKNNCQIITVNWLDAGLLTPDILARFPYDEHPNNIALVLELGRYMGVEDAYTLKEMADRVVPDLGVLKTFPIAPMQGRNLQFINGMSANERFGALGNWTRLELDKKNLSNSPESWIVTVVNNRDDRVARSQVFANFLVRDISADRHVLIGSNLSGLMGFIEKTWQVFMEEQGMVSDADKSTVRTNLSSLAAHLRIPQHIDEVEARLEQMCKGLGVAVPAERPLSSDMLLNQESSLDSVEQAEAIVSQYEYDCEQHGILEGLLNDLDGQGGNGPLSEIQDQLWQWFKVKLVVVDDYYITGNQLVQKLCQQCAPGLLSSIMGLQNIKGTGLDFVYRWQAWEKNYELCLQLQSEDEEQARTALRDLAQVQSFGVLDNETVLQSLKQAQASHFSQTELCQAQIVATQAQLTQQLEAVTSAKQENKIVKWFGPMLDQLESFIDVGDAVKRRRKSNQIIKDLVNLRISQGKAARELSLITQKQKGGWLKKALFR
ncbi:MAG: hypothetical protein KUG71_07480, partial [Porticoccaceae bacterium]|nr:hypothetical protein [Porticoccaceae bacterium]